MIIRKTYFEGGVLDVTFVVRGLSNPLRDLAPDVVPSLSEQVTFLGAPDMLVNFGLRVKRGVHHLNVQVGQIVDMNIVHGRLPGSDDGCFSTFERHVGHHIYLSTLGVANTSALTINGRWANDRRLYGWVLRGSEHDLVDVAVEGMIRETGERVYALEIVVRLVR